MSTDEEFDSMAMPTEELAMGPAVDPPTTPPRWFGGRSAAAGSAAAAVDSAPPPARPRSFLAGLAGVLVTVLALLALGIVGTQVFSIAHGEPGPGALTVTAHLAAALTGVALYRLVSTRTGLTRPVAALALVAVTGAVLWFFWWA